MNKYKRAELKVARAYGARRQPGSGCCPDIDLKGDSRIPGVLRIEQKNPGSPTFVLKLIDLQTLWNMSITCGELPLFLISTEYIWRQSVLDVVVVDASDYLSLAKDTDKFLRLPEITMKKQKKLNLIDLTSALEGDPVLDMAASWVRYLPLKTPLREYVIMLRSDFDVLWRRKCSKT
jgi:hypothetical protein